MKLRKLLPPFQINWRVSKYAGVYIVPLLHPGVKNRMKNGTALGEKIGKNWQFFGPKSQFLARKA